MTIESFAFKNGGELPTRFTCDGEGINPELAFKGVPKEAKSLVLIVDDPDAPRGTWDHWVVWNIPPHTTEIPQNSTPKGAVVGLNSSKENFYDSPCPPSGFHRYFFKLYALDKMLDLSSNHKSQDLLKVIEGHILAKAELMGRYKRK